MRPTDAGGEGPGSPGLLHPWGEEPRKVFKGWAGPSHFGVGAFGQSRGGLAGPGGSVGLSCPGLLSPMATSCSRLARCLPYQHQSRLPAAPSWQHPARDAETQHTRVTPGCLKIADRSCWRGKGGPPLPMPQGPSLGVRLPHAAHGPRRCRYQPLPRCNFTPRNWGLPPSVKYLRSLQRVA